MIVYFTIKLIPVLSLFHLPFSRSIMRPVISTLVTASKRVLRYIFILVLLVSIHWGGVRFYAAYCAPPSVIGLLWSFMTAASPVCSGALYVIEKTSGMYSMFSMVVATACIETIVSVYHAIGFSADKRITHPTSHITHST